MRIRVSFIEIIAAVSAAAAAAQPDKDQQHPKAPQTATTPVVLASASDVRQPPTAPVRRPAPRVTTCRCGDPQVTQDQSAKEQPER